jgi:DeoD family purine-nucleoside phosphorylase
MPIHLRAEPGDYAPAVLCPGDPRRATYVAETFFDDVRCVNEERGMLGYTGTFEGRPISVQSTGMGCPSAAIVYEELIQLGATRLIRIGTGGGLQPGLAFADTIIVLAATSHDQTYRAYTDGTDHSPVADWTLLDTAWRLARERGLSPRVGAIVTSDAFYSESRTNMQRWANLGHLGIDMETGVLYTIAAVRNVSALTVLTVSDILYEGAPQRISDEELRRGVDGMMELAARVATADIEPPWRTTGTRSPSRG